MTSAMITRSWTTWIAGGLHLAYQLVGDAAREDRSAGEEQRHEHPAPPAIHTLACSGRWWDASSVTLRPRATLIQPRVRFGAPWGSSLRLDRHT